MGVDEMSGRSWAWLGGIVGVGGLCSGLYPHVRQPHQLQPVLPFYFLIQHLGIVLSAKLPCPPIRSTRVTPHVCMHPPCMQPS